MPQFDSVTLGYLKTKVEILYDTKEVTLTPPPSPTNYEASVLHLPRMRDAQAGGATGGAMRYA